MSRTRMTSRPPRQPRGGARIALVLTATVVLIGAALGWTAWLASERILGPSRPPTLREQRVLAEAPGRIRLSRDGESMQAGAWALEWAGGYGRVGRVLASDASAVEREFRAVVGRPPVGGYASLRGVARGTDPLEMLGLSYEEVLIDGPLGGCPAWLVPGRDPTWVVYVHGRGANRAEGLRTLATLSARGLPGLLVTYRNDPGAPASPDGFTHLGLTEWQDLEAAVRWALAHGARDVLLAGYSMGGQVALQFVERSALAPHVRALVLESPVLDWEATLAARARAEGFPQAGVALGRFAASLRAGVDWQRLDQVGRAPLRLPPTLLFHNVHDRFAPFGRSAAFARRRPASVTFVPIEGGNHVEAWNAGPARYAHTLEAWCDAHGIGTGPASHEGPRARPAPTPARDPGEVVWHARS